jgi:group II intron reverse transcriptase/maturase
MQRVEQPVMTTGLERIAAKARDDRKLKFTSLAHHITEELLWESVNHIPKNSAPGSDGQTVKDAKESFKQWAPEMLRAIHNRGYQPPPILRVFIPKPGKKEKRPLGIPCVTDRALQRSVAAVLSAIYEQDFLPCSFGGRPKQGAHHALATLGEILSRVPAMSYVYEADLKNYFGSLDHGILLRFLEERVGDPRIISLIRRWLKAGVLEKGELTPSEHGTPQGGSISVLLSNLYLHAVLDLWFEQQVKPRLRGEAYLVRYIDDFVICFQFKEDADRVQAVLSKRLNKFALALEPSKTKLVKFGRFAQREARVQGKRPETFSFLGITHYATYNRKGNYKVGRKTEKSRLRRTLATLRELMRAIRHWSLKDQVDRVNQSLRGHYAYYGLAGNWRSLHKVYRFVERYWHKMLCSRSWAARVTWAVFHRLRDLFPLQRPTIYLSYQGMQACAVL